MQYLVATCVIIWCNLILRMLSYLENYPVGIFTHKLDRNGPRGGLRCVPMCEHGLASSACACGAQHEKKKPHANRCINAKLKETGTIDLRGDCRILVCQIICTVKDFIAVLQVRDVHRKPPFRVHGERSYVTTVCVGSLWIFYSERIMFLPFFYSKEWKKWEAKLKPTYNLPEKQWVG